MAKINKSDKFFEVLSNASGMSKENIREIAKEVLYNNKKLNACSNHVFIEKVGIRKWKCANCGGLVDGSKKVWYELGREHEIKRKGE
ncbi:MAG: hypothetical protein GY861_14270 [bacterium]|nr:hypothetical protein [bacterium]